MGALYDFGVRLGVTEANGVYTTAQAEVALVAAPGANKEIWVVGVTVHSKVAGNIALRDGSALVGSHRYDVSATGGMVCGIGDCLTRWGSNKGITVTTDITGNHIVRVYYFIRG